MQDSAALTGVNRSGRQLIEECGAFPADTQQLRGFAWHLLPTTVVTQSNSEYPRRLQDGLRWSGRGLSATMATGAAVRWGPVTAALAPTLSYQQNESFPILPVTTPGLSPVGSYHHRGAIDHPQRFGEASFWSIHPGQSFVRADAYGAAVGFSTENMVWGPARRNPILMSSAAPGFPHVFLGTSRPVNLRIVTVSVEAIWGRLSESDYFDDDPDNDRRLFSGIIGTVSPRGTGLTIGLARSYVRTIPPGGLSLGDQIFGPYTGVRNNPDDDLNGDNQLLSIFFSWALPASAFEVYGEFAREDHWEDARDLFMQLDHSRGYTFGLQKLQRAGNGESFFAVLAEATNLGHSSTFRIGRPGATFYTHSQVIQGYTHRGQLLGAPIGPGADAQYVGVDYITPRWFGGLNYERVRSENDVYYNTYASSFSNRGHDTEWTLGARGGAGYRGWQLVGELAYSKRYNRDFVDLQTSGQVASANNLSVTLGLAWLPFAGRSVP